MNVELTVECVASEWTTTSADTEWAGVAAVRGTAKPEKQLARRKLQVLWREDSFTVPIWTSADVRVLAAWVDNS